MDRRYGPDDQDEKVELNTYRTGFQNNSFEHPEPFSPSPVSPRPLTPIRPGHFPTDEFGQPVWLQPTARMSGHSDWDSRTPYDSRSASPTLVSTDLFFVLFILGIDHGLTTSPPYSTKTMESRKVTRVWLP